MTLRLSPHSFAHGRASGKGLGLPTFSLEAHRHPTLQGRRKVSPRRVSLAWSRTFPSTLRCLGMKSHWKIHKIGEHAPAAVNPQAFAGNPRARRRFAGNSCRACVRPACAGRGVQACTWAGIPATYEYNNTIAICWSEVRGRRNWPPRCADARSAHFPLGDATARSDGDPQRPPCPSPTFVAHARGLAALQWPSAHGPGQVVPTRRRALPRAWMVARRSGSCYSHERQQAGQAIRSTFGWFGVMGARH